MCRSWLSWCDGVLSRAERWKTTMEDDPVCEAGVGGGVYVEGWLFGPSERESGEVCSVLKVLRGGNTKTTLSGRPRYYWVVSRICT